MSKLYFLDTEFIENGKTIDLISIGIVCEDGRTLYKQSTECSFGYASDWVWRNVYPSLHHFDMRGMRSCSPKTETYDSGLGKRTIVQCKPECPWATRQEIRDAVLDFCNIEKHGKPRFWGYFCDYDWVAFCQLFGTMVQLPKGFPMYCRDIKQWADMLGDIRIPAADGSNHNALDDAKWACSAYHYLTEFAQTPQPAPIDKI